MTKKISAMCFVLVHSKKDHAVSFCPSLKSALRWLFVLCLVLGTHTVQAQHWLPLYTQDFGIGTANTTSSTPSLILSPGTTNYTAITAYGTSPYDGYYAISTNSQNGGIGWNVWISANDHTTGTGTGYM